MTGCKMMLKAECAEGLFHSGKHLMESKRNGYSNRDAWMAERTDRDLWEVLEQLLQAKEGGGRTLASRVTIHWVKAHADDHTEIHLLPWYH